MDTADAFLIDSLSLSLLFLVIAVSFRLMDNSALLLLKKEIFVASPYVSTLVIKRHIVASADKEFKTKLKRTLVYRCLHKLFLVLMAASLLVTLGTIILS